MKPLVRLFRSAAPHALLFAVFIATLEASAPISFATDPWIGMWDLNVAQSRLRPAVTPKSDVRIFVPTHDGEKATYHEVDSSGRPTHTASLYRFDGRDNPVTGSEGKNTLAFTRSDSRTLAFVTRHEGKEIQRGTRSITKDGRTLTVTVKGADATGKPFEDVYVFDRRVAKSPADVVKNALQFHDPQNRWSQFSGQVRLVTNFGAGGGNLGEEIIELRNADGYYKRTTTLRGVATVQGVERGAPFWTPGSGSGDAAAKKKRPSDEAIKWLQRHQLAHIGFMMEIANSGLQLGPTMESTELQGRPVHAISFSRSSKVVDPYWNVDIVVYVDRDTFVLSGYKLASGDLANRTTVVLGDLDIGGIRLPRAKAYYGANGAYQFTDLFTRP